MTHTITGFEQHVTPEGATLHRWICSCTRRGSWTAAGLAESAARKHAKSPRVIGMNRYAAAELCGQIWKHLGQPFTRIRAKNIANRFEVGYLGNWPNDSAHILGAGETWELAFERATSKEAP